MNFILPVIPTGERFTAHSSDSGKELCCHRDRANDWEEVRMQLWEVWEDKPRLFEERIEVDIMLYIDK